jgi:hypothetical protein
VEVNAAAPTDKPAAEHEDVPSQVEGDEATQQQQQQQEEQVIHVQAIAPDASMCGALELFMPARLLT